MKFLGVARFRERILETARAFPCFRSGSHNGLALRPADLVGVILQTARRGVAQSVSQGAAFEDDSRRLSQTLHEPLDAFQAPARLHALVGPWSSRAARCIASASWLGSGVSTRAGPKAFFWRRGSARAWIPEADGNRRIWRIFCVTN